MEREVEIDEIVIKQKFKKMEDFLVSMSYNKILKEY